MACAVDSTQGNGPNATICGETVAQRAIATVGTQIVSVWNSTSQATSIGHCTRIIWRDPKDEFVRQYRDPNNYQPESINANRSHRYEAE